MFIFEWFDLILKGFISKALVNMFNSALSETPSDPSGLTALAVWIFSCIVLVFLALFFYIVILVNLKSVSMRSTRKISSVNAEISSDSVDLDLLFLIIHTAAFALFLITYTFTYYLSWIKSQSNVIKKHRIEKNLEVYFRCKIVSHPKHNLKKRFLWS